MAALDPRVVRVGITIDGETTFYEDYQVLAKGSKVSSTLAGQADITITGMGSDLRNKILQATKPGRATNIKRVTVALEVGRESYGASLYYKGDVFRSSPVPKPDIGITLKCLTGYANKRTIIRRGGTGELISLSEIAKQVANDNEYKLSFQITDKYIRNYTFTGSVHESLVDLERLAETDVYVDKDTLFIKNETDEGKGTGVFTVSNANRTLIKADATEVGVNVKMMFHPSVTIGSAIELESELNPSINGKYRVYKVDFDITKRGTPFYLTVEAM